MEPDKSAAFEAAVESRVQRRLAEHAQQETSKRSRVLDWALLAVAAVVVIGVIAWIVSGVIGSDPRQQATEACHDAVAEQMKDPSSAEFSSTSHEQVSDSQWIVSGVVRATNSFGGVVPSDYSCTVHVGDSMNLVLDLTID